MSLSATVYSFFFPFHCYLFLHHLSQVFSPFLIHFIPPFTSISIQFFSSFSIMYHLALFPSYLFQKLHFFCYFFPLPSARAMLHVQLNLLDILLVDRRGNQGSDSIGHSLGYASSKYSGECLFCLLSCLILSCILFSQLFVLNSVQPHTSSLLSHSHLI